MTTTSTPGTAAVVETAVEDIMKVEPTIMTTIGMFVPGAAPVAAMVQPIILLAVPFIERALKDITNGNGGDILGAMIELVQHVSAGQPNSPILDAIPPGKTPVPDMPVAPSA